MKIKKIEGSLKEKADFLNLLKKTDALFKPPLSTRVSLNNFCEKVFSDGVVFVIVNEEEEFDAGCAFYCTPDNYDYAFLTYIASLKSGMGQILIEAMIKYCREKEMDGIETQTWKTNKKSISLFENNGFKVYKEIPNRRIDETSLLLRLTFND